MSLLYLYHFKFNSKCVNKGYLSSSGPTSDRKRLRATVKWYNCTDRPFFTVRTELNSQKWEKGLQPRFPEKLGCCVKR